MIELPVWTGFDDIEIETTVSVTKEAWNKMLESVVTEARYAKEELEEMFEDEDEEEAESTGYIDANGHVHDTAPDLSQVALYLQERDITMGWMLNLMGALPVLRDSVLRALDEREDREKYDAIYQQLKACEDLSSAMLGYDEAENQLVEIVDEYPTLLLETIAQELEEQPVFHNIVFMDSILVNDIFELFPFVDEETNEPMYEILDADKAIESFGVLSKSLVDTYYNAETNQYDEDGLENEIYRMKK